MSLNSSLNSKIYYFEIASLEINYSSF